MMRTTRRKITKNSGPSKKLPIRKQEFEIPKAFLKSLMEFSEGGFFLIIGDGRGQPRVYKNFDRSIDAIALTKFGKDYFNKADSTITEVIEADSAAMEIEEFDDEED